MRRDSTSNLSIENLNLQLEKFFVINEKLQLFWTSYNTRIKCLEVLSAPANKIKQLEN